MKTVQLNVDNELIERCLKGDQGAWKDLVNRYQRLVYSIAHIFCSNQEDVADVFQQVWLELYQQLRDLRNVEALPAWLMTVTKRRSYAALHARYGSEPLENDIPDGSEKLSQIEREHSIEQALDQMPDRCRRLIDLLYFDASEPSYSEISKALGMPEASIGPTRARCLEKLRKLLA
ncbi:MAG TPA: sigma-70 family RNA polymerase sigma factor [Terriglobia bacterium]|nr:sigma-70 family RNA polymerase sigma factor [Terriglobia bacterium]